MLWLDAAEEMPAGVKVKVELAPLLGGMLPGLDVGEVLPVVATLLLDGETGGTTVCG